MHLSPEIEARLKEWTNPPYDADCIKEINDLIKANDEKELTDRFGADLDFGTGGIRGIIANGTNRMNKYIIAKSTQGLANYILKCGINNPSAVVKTIVTTNLQDNIGKSFYIKVFNVSTIEAARMSRIIRHHRERGGNISLKVSVLDLPLFPCRSLKRGNLFKLSL